MDHIQLGLDDPSVFKESSHVGMDKGGMYDISLHTAGVLVWADPELLQVETIQATTGFWKPWEKPSLGHLKSSRKNENKPNNLFQAAYGTPSHMLHPTVEWPTSEWPFDCQKTFLPAERGVKAQRPWKGVYKISSHCKLASSVHTWPSWLCL